MRSPLKLSALLALVLLTFSLVGGTGVGAQDGVDAPDLEESSFQPEDLDGLQYGVARSYSVDFDTMLEASSTPGADLSMPTGLMFIGGLVLEFDSNDSAEAGLDRMLEEVDAAAMAEADESMEEWDSGLGNRNFSYVYSYEYDGTVTETAVSMFQQDNFIYLVSLSGSDVDAKAVTSSFGQILIDNDGSGEGTFNEDGTSTGGLWDKFPSADDELVAGLVPMDEILFPDTGEE